MEKNSKSSPRVIWEEQLDYLTTCISLTIGVGNIVNFPAKCYKHGGATYLVAYFIILFSFGIPIFYMELIMGQYHRCTSTVLLRRCAPALQVMDGCSHTVHRVTYYAIPDIVEHMPDVWFWFVITYLCVGLLGFSTICIMIIAMSVPIADVFNIPTKSYKHDLIALGVIFVCWLINLPFCFKSGFFWISLISEVGHFCQGATIFMQVVVLSYYYGAENIIDDLIILMGQPKNFISQNFGYASPVWYFSWKYYCPIVALAFTIVVFVREFPSQLDDIRYPYLYDRQLRSWRRLSEKMINDDEEEYNRLLSILPDREPGDPTGFLKALYKQFFFVAQNPYIAVCLN
ncbi:unnamed protein product [Caenorhabditis bovis]|uniref:Uncharacterized protein n=1 Tax=Caenorhabditis bovis TaxID=2654633 RepID=A0A8S1FDY1_9PELO|nr:unnamed protein product [Caenorhabditis bovis]